jgi:hypothetical protein
MRSPQFRSPVLPHWEFQKNGRKWTDLEKKSKSKHNYKPHQNIVHQLDGNGITYTWRKNERNLITYLNHRGVEEATAVVGTSPLLHGSKVKGEVRSRGPAKPATLREAQEASASTSATSLEADWLGQAGTKQPEASQAVWLVSKGNRAIKPNLHGLKNQ